MLEHRLNYSHIPYNKEAFIQLKNVLKNSETVDYDKVISLTESLI